MKLERKFSTIFFYFDFKSSIKLALNSIDFVYNFKSWVTTIENIMDKKQIRTIFLSQEFRWILFNRNNKACFSLSSLFRSIKFCSNVIRHVRFELNLKLKTAEKKNYTCYEKIKKLPE